MDKRNIRIAVIVGGASPEREVSKQSGKAIYEAVCNLGYNVKIIDPALGANQPSHIEDFFTSKDTFSLDTKNYIKVINSDLFNDVDLALIALHGKWGEDGTVQSLFELRGINYSGSGVLGSSLSMDKARSKVMFKHFGVSTPKWIRVEKNTSIQDIADEIDASLNNPSIVKPNDQGSTLGLTKCLSKEDLNDAFELAYTYSDVILIEEFIEGREIAVGIIGDRILPLLEIVPKHEIYDYECKYTDGMSEYIVPAELDQEVEENLKYQSKLAYNSLGCENYGRVDFRLTKEGEIFCFEVNTLPGMTNHSLLPKMAKADGIEFEELIEMIITSTYEKTKN
ncbi:MAG: D-alanine--D-alanine ligase [Melioribacteraceae bacterium]|nr:D-alanine--D-alanine ligase [Melioribacteraceae bacterium]